MTSRLSALGGAHNWRRLVDTIYGFGVQDSNSFDEEQKPLLISHIAVVGGSYSG